MDKCQHKHWGLSYDEGADEATFYCYDEKMITSDRVLMRSKAAKFMGITGGAARKKLGGYHELGKIGMKSRWKNHTKKEEKPQKTTKSSVTI